MRSIVMARCVAATATLLLCAAEPHAQTKTPGQIDMPAPVRITTSEYIQQAAMGDLFEIEASKLAVEKADNKDVKNLAERMVKDHGISAKRFADAVAKGETGVVAPLELDGEHKAKIALLRNASGAEFDKIYISALREAHEKGLTLHRTYARSGDNAELKAAAGEIAPLVESHLNTIKDSQAATPKP